MRLSELLLTPAQRDRRQETPTYMHVGGVGLQKSGSQSTQELLKKHITSSASKSKLSMKPPMQMTPYISKPHNPSIVSASSLFCESKPSPIVHRKKQKQSG